MCFTIIHLKENFEGTAGQTYYSSRWYLGHSLFISQIKEQNRTIPGIVLVSLILYMIPKCLYAILLNIISFILRSITNHYRKYLQIKCFLSEDPSFCCVLVPAGSENLEMHQATF